MNLKSEPQISVVIPALNEAARLGVTLSKILAYLTAQHLTYEVIVVDDGSTDKTQEVVARFLELNVVLVNHPVNLGKGAAVRTGVMASNGERILITDADLSTPIDDLARLLAFSDKAPLVFGSRAVPGSVILLRQPLYRVIMGKTFNLMIRVLGVSRIHDTQCGFKLLDGQVARDLFSRVRTLGFAFDVELTWLAQREGLPIEEVGVRWANSLDSRVNPILDPPRMIVDILRFRWRHRRFFRGLLFWRSRPRRLESQWAKDSHVQS